MCPYGGAVKLTHTHTHTRGCLDKQNDSKTVGSCSRAIRLSCLSSARFIDATLRLQNFKTREMKNAVLSD
jgi:hypothetical protein